jgi:hypothetical protein
VCSAECKKVIGNFKIYKWLSWGKEQNLDCQREITEKPILIKHEKTFQQCKESYVFLPETALLKLAGGGENILICFFIRDFS